MTEETPAAPESKKLYWTGWVLTVLPALMLMLSAVMKLLKPPEFVDQFAKLGWDADLALGIGIVELISAILYLVPRTTVLGAILLTGYLGGAIATHVRLHEQFVMPVILGVVLWGGLYLRDNRLRALLPWRT